MTKKLDVKIDFWMKTAERKLHKKIRLGGCYLAFNLFKYQSFFSIIVT